jgi:hypothetical protein
VWPVMALHGNGGEELINSLKIVTTLIHKIPPNLPFPKGGITPLWQRGARGDFPMRVSIQF